MDQRKTISDKDLRRVIQRQKQTLEPPFITERIMQHVREVHQRKLRKERLFVFIPVVIGGLILCMSGLMLGMRYLQTATESTPHERLCAVCIIAGYLLYELQRQLCKRWGIPK